MRKLVKFILLIPVAILTVTLFYAYCEGREQSGSEESFSCLAVGYDEAAENTDVIFVVSYNGKENAISFVQIPRDSFTEYSGKCGKINRIYSSLRAKGAKREEALSELKASIEEYLGLKLDASLALSLDALERFVDNIGGVYINIPETFDITRLPMGLSYGENILSGKEALKFVRERSKYQNADLDRLDTQKIFLEGVFHTLFERLDAKTLIKLVLTQDDEVTVQAPIVELSTFLLRDFNRIKGARAAFLTLPGSACEYNGVSYYVINRSSARDAVKKFLFSDGESFDKKYRLTEAKNSVIDELYRKKMTAYFAYVDGKMLNIKTD